MDVISTIFVFFFPFKKAICYQLYVITVLLRINIYINHDAMMCFISCTKIVFVDSPCQPLLLLALTKKRAPASTTE